MGPGISAYPWRIYSVCGSEVDRSLNRDASASKLQSLERHVRREVLKAVAIPSKKIISSYHNWLSGARQTPRFYWCGSWKPIA
jgi:hypothetical protein